MKGVLIATRNAEENQTEQSVLWVFGATNLEECVEVKVVLGLVWASATKKNVYSLRSMRIYQRIHRQSVW